MPMRGERICNERREINDLFKLNNILLWYLKVKLLL